MLNKVRIAQTAILSMCVLLLLAMAMCVQLSGADHSGFPDGEFEEGSTEAEGHTETCEQYWRTPQEEDAQFESDPSRYIDVARTVREMRWTRFDDYVQQGIAKRIKLDVKRATDLIMEWCSAAMKWKLLERRTRPLSEVLAQHDDARFIAKANKCFDTIDLLLLERIMNDRLDDHSEPLFILRMLDLE